LQIAAEENLLRPEESGIIILPAGEEFLLKINSEPEFLAKEKKQLDLLGKKHTETMVAKTARDWE
ncbi:hypothetical protein ACPTKC_30245, partial [Pseudomonas aeruginosa]